MASGYERGNFTNFRADIKRANRQMYHTFKLAEQNGVSNDALATACLNAATALLTHEGGRDQAISSLKTMVDRIYAGEYDGDKQNFLN